MKNKFKEINLSPFIEICKKNNVPFQFQKSTAIMIECDENTFHELFRKAMDNDCKDNMFLKQIMTNGENVFVTSILGQEVVLSQCLEDENPKSLG